MALRLIYILSGRQHKYMRLQFTLFAFFSSENTEIGPYTPMRDWSKQVDGRRTPVHVHRYEYRCERCERGVGSCTPTGDVLLMLPPGVMTFIILPMTMTE